MNIQLMIHDTETPKHLRGIFPKRCGVGKMTISGKTFETLFPTQAIARKYFEDTFDVSYMDWDHNHEMDFDATSVEVDLIS